MKRKVLWNPYVLVYLDGTFWKAILKMVFSQASAENAFGSSLHPHSLIRDEVGQPVFDSSLAVTTKTDFCCMTNLILMWNKLLHLSISLVVSAESCALTSSGVRADRIEYFEHSKRKSDEHRHEQKEFKDC